MLFNYYSNRLYNQLNPMKTLMKKTILPALSLSLVSISLFAGDVAHWALDETSGTDTFDLSGNSLNGAYQGTYTLNQAGQFGTAVDFDGSTGEVFKGATSALYNLRNDFTVAAWVNADSVTGTQRIFSSAGGQWGFGLAGDKLQFTAFGIIDATSTATVAADTWTHVAVGVSADNFASFYINGSYIDTINITSETNQNTGVNWFIGSSGDGQRFDGTLDELHIFGSELGENQVSSLATTNSIPEPSTAAYLFFIGIATIMFRRRA